MNNRLAAGYKTRTMEPTVLAMLGLEGLPKFHAFK